jgi:hypothetical protein
MLDTSKLADKVLDELYAGGLYTDMTRVQIKDSIENYILHEYSLKLEKLNKKIDLKVVSGKKLSPEDYEDDFEDIKDELIEMLQELSKTDKLD